MLTFRQGYVNRRQPCRTFRKMQKPEPSFSKIGRTSGSFINLSLSIKDRYTDMPVFSVATCVPATVSTNWLLMPSATIMRSLNRVEPSSQLMMAASQLTSAAARPR